VYRFHDSTNRWWNAITKNIAKYSYGLYLMHTPALWLVFNVWGLRNPYLAGPLWLAVTGAASVIAFHVLEEPMIQYGKRWAAASAPAPVAQAGAALCPAEQA
jgi:peptidoglycan/LPS O-acetylase OafA/YrhL